MTWSVWLLFTMTETALCLTPGPAVLFVVSYGLTRGGRNSLWANAGILSGNAMYFLLSAFGLGAVLLASYEVFTVIKYVGAAYLLYLGVQTFRGRGLGLAPSNDGKPTAPGWRALVRGFSLQAANPKALIFFAALLPQFISPKSPVAPQVAILGMTSVSIEFLVLAGYGYLAGGAASVARKPQFVAATNRASGVMLIAAGAGLAFANEK